MSNRFRISLELVLVLSLATSLAFGRVGRYGAARTDGATSGIDKLVGTWRRIGDLGEDGKVKPFDAFYVQLKHITPTHFTWFVMFPKTHTSEIGYSGRCSVKDDTYTEYIEAISGPFAPPFSVTGDPPAHAKSRAPQPAYNPAAEPPVNIKFRIEGDRGFFTLPVEFTGGKPATEVWVRMKAGEKFEN